MIDTLFFCGIAAAVIALNGCDLTTGLAVIGACVLVCRLRVSAVLLPLRAVGSMPLTAYVGQLVAWAIGAAVVLGDTAGFRALQPFWPFVLATLVGCTVWALIWGRGPLERMIAAITRRLVPR